MSRFAVLYPNGHRVEFRASDWGAAKNQTNVDGTRFFLSGKEVDAPAYFEAVAAAETAWYTKKNETHKQVRTLYGTSVGCYVTKWVRR